MAVDGITVRIADDTVSRYLQSLQAKLADMHPAMDAIGAVLEREINLRFDLKQDPGGQSWAPLAPATLKRYAQADRRPARGGGTEVVRAGTLLERTGLMRASLNHVASADQVEVGFGRPYAAYHEFGTSRMPRRGLLTTNPQTGELGAEDRRSVLEVIEAFLADANGS